MFGTRQIKLSIFGKIFDLLDHFDTGEILMQETPAFSHRQNPDSTFDSICKRCYRTIATTESESDLIRSEKEHTCEHPMPSPDDGQMRIVGVDRADADGVIVEYSNNSSVLYKQDQLQTLQPERIVTEGEDNDE